MSNSFWSRLASRLPCRKTTCRASYKRPRFRLGLDHLEDRTVPAVDITAFNTTAGTVTFSGDQNGTTADTLILSQTTVNGQVVLTHNLVGSGAAGNYADATDIDPSSGVAQLVLGTGTSPRITVNLGADADQFRLDSSWSFLHAVEIHGDAGDDTVTGPNAVASWVLSGSASGSLGANVSFDSIESLQGGSAADTFDVAASFAGAIRAGAGDDRFLLHDGVTISGSIAGELGTDTLSFAAVTTAVTVDLGASTATGVSAFAGIEAFVGGSASDTLLGANAAATWTINGANAGIVTNAAGSVTFSAFENLTGGSEADVFAVVSGGKLSGLLSGGGGGDTLSFSAATQPLIFVLTGADTGIVVVVDSNLHFAAIENLVGGQAHDRFLVQPGATLSGSINGGAGLDTISYAGFTTAVQVNLSTGVATAINGGLANFENAQGGAGNDILLGNALANRLAGNGGNDILVGFAGNDVLSGGAGRDLLVGSHGADTLNGGAGEDILIGGRLTYSVEAMVNLMAEWGRTDLNYHQRTARLRKNLEGAIFNDSVADRLTGGADLDWFLYHRDDTLTDGNQPGGERRTRLKS